MEPSTGVKTWQWVVTVIVIIVLIVIGVLVFGSKGSQAPTASDNTSSTTASTGTTVNRVSMTDQYPGNVVYLNSVQLAQPGWVAIQADSNGQPGAVIGSAHFDAGLSPGSKITLTQPMVDGQMYYAVIYTDDGSGSFNTATDQPLKDANGNVIMNTFRATTAAGAGLKG